MKLKSGAVLSWAPEIYLFGSEVKILGCFMQSTDVFFVSFWLKGKQSRLPQSKRGCRLCGQTGRQETCRTYAAEFIRGLESHNSSWEMLAMLPRRNECGVFAA